MIKNKQQMQELLMAGAFGNRVRVWNSYADYKKDGCPCNVGIMYRDPRGGGGPFVPNVDPLEVEMEMLVLRSAGWKLEYMVLGEATPDDLLVLNGEICEKDDVGYALHYSTLKLPMRAALKGEPRWVQGPGALLVLKSVLTDSSYGDLKALMDQFPYAAIELSVFRCCLGTIPGRNAVIWEVRNY
jgi:hypothetical protein